MEGTIPALFLLIAAPFWAATPAQEEDAVITDQERSQAVAAILAEIKHRMRPAVDGSPAAFEQFLARRHYDVPRVEVLPGNVGDVKLNGFAPYEFAGFRKAVGDAMSFVSGTDALIIDPGQNGGAICPRWRTW
jgi:hypothetical protein